MIRATPSRRSPRRARGCWRSIPQAGRTALVRRRSGGTVSAITCCRSWASSASTASPRQTSCPCCCCTGQRSTRRCAASSSGSAASSAGQWPRATGRTIPPEPRSTRPCPGTGRSTRHFAALPHGEVAAAIAKVRNSGAWPGTKAAFEFLVLTACRSGEVRLSEWREVDLASGVCAIPADRSKTRREHKVPLAP